MTEQDIREINGLLARHHDMQGKLWLTDKARMDIELELLRRWGLKVDNPTDPTPNCPPGGTADALRIAA